MYVCTQPGYMYIRVSKRRSAPDGHNDRDNERRASVRQTDGSSAVQNGRDAGADISIKRRRFPLCSSALPLSPTEPSVSPHWTSVKRKSRAKVSRVACRRARGWALNGGAWLSTSRGRGTIDLRCIHSPCTRPVTGLNTNTMLLLLLYCTSLAAASS